MREFRISAEPINTAALSREMQQSECGALVTFEGWVRNHNEGKAVLGLSYETYDALCYSEALKIMAEADQLWELRKILCVHRKGALGIGDVAVWVGVTAVHRGQAFDGCEFMIDQVKLRLPIWKLEHYEDGNREWVNCGECEKHRHGSLAHSHGHEHWS